MMSFVLCIDVSVFVLELQFYNTKCRFAFLHISSSYRPWRHCGSHGDNSLTSHFWVLYMGWQLGGENWLWMFWNVKIDFELVEGKPKMLVRSTVDDWLNNLSTILQWSPYATEVDLMKQVSTQTISCAILMCWACINYMWTFVLTFFPCLSEIYFGVKQDARVNSVM